jgi:GxxExxY protein
MDKKYLNDLTYRVLGCCIAVHKELGPGLLESVYHKCLKHELHYNQIHFHSELAVRIDYKGLDVQADLRCDLLIENCLVLEIKSVEYVLPIHEAQLLTYMRLLKVPKGILVNFNTINIFKEGQKTFVNELFRNLPDHL